MKLALTALLILGLSRLHAATVSPVLGEMAVELFVLDAVNGNSLVCYPSNVCSYPCVSLSSSSSAFTVSPRNPDCSSDPEVRFPSITAYGVVDDMTSLSHLETDSSRVPISCSLEQTRENYKYYHCGPILVPDSVATTTSTTTTTTTTPAVTTTATVTAHTCSNKDSIFDKKKGIGYNGDCCKTEADCKDECIKGKCTGPSRTTTKSTTTNSTTKKPITTKKSTTTTKPSTKPSTKSATTKSATTKSATTKSTIVTTTAKSTISPSVCTPGYQDKKKGDGPKDACCSTQLDCKEDCVKGRCN
ncbi:hypothetical protein A0J61_03922 [Choanephora cucurbitarum]|uniref:Uncharacterized protein n=1 Tax=Choanephora cucurbitarum TaxID=101091 RepID=A0A1C7NFZ5_9FUNG|nr:hypothetical protein A0J61_03922 [Choanephora cucurbitarum]